jgi:hypothetical protein
MAKKKPKSSRSKRKKGGWTSKLVTFITFILFFVVLSFVLSTLLRWILPPRSDPIFGRNVIRVEVLNGCGEQGIAEMVTDWLRREGFDIVYFGNADSFEYEKTILYDRSGRPEFVQEVATVLGCKNTERSFDGLLLLDVSVVVGKDWEKLQFETVDRGVWESAAYRYREVLEEWLGP